MVKMCCANCTHCLRLIKSDHSGGGCRDTDMDGYICTLFGNEPEKQFRGVAFWMVGLDKETAFCEGYNMRVKELEEQE